MPARSFRAGGFGISVEVPGSVGRALRRVVRRPETTSESGSLYVSPTVPPLKVKKRSPNATIEAFRGNNPDTEGSAALREQGTDIQSRIDAHDWYHTIELPGGKLTPGVFDHRTLVSHYGIADDLTGKKVIDVATFDGFWAFEFEKRGADVVALDLPRLSNVDFPPQVKTAMIEAGLDQEMGHGFSLASEALGSQVKRIWGSVYEMDAESTGRFDLVHIADVLLHLERPLDALRAIRRITSDSGEALIVDSYDPSIDDMMGRTLTQYIGGWWDVTWWLPSLDTLAQMVLDAGFSHVSVHRIYNLAKTNETQGYWRAILKARP